MVAAVYSRTVSYLILLELGFRERRRIIINFLETLLILFDVSPHIQFTLRSFGSDNGFNWITDVN
jgi:hypothetical protein